MAATEVEGGKRHEIYLHHAYDLWTEQKRAYLLQQTASTRATWYHADETFALHILAVHAKFCTELICGGSSNSGAGFLSRSPSSHSASYRARSTNENTSNANSESNSKTTVSVVNEETKDSALPSDTTSAHEHHLTVIEDEDVTSQDALSGVTENVPSEESQVIAEECSTGLKIKTEQEDASPLQDTDLTEDSYEPENSGNESSQDISDFPGASCDQQTRWMTDMSHEVEHEDDGTFEENPDRQLEESKSNLGRTDALPNIATETQDHITTRTECRDPARKLLDSPPQGNIDQQSEGSRNTSGRTDTLSSVTTKTHCQSSDDMTGRKSLRQVCQEAFSRASDAKQKTQTDIGETPNLGEICDDSVNLKSNPNPNIERDTDMKGSVCDDHAKPSTSNISPLYTTISHKGGKTYICNICSTPFHFKNHLNFHMKTHTGEKPHKCNLCSKAYPDKSKLISHMRTHTGEKPFKCDICSKAFGQKSILKRHTRKHDSESPYNCNLCSKSFSDEYNLDSHMRTHTGERPHKCDICSKAFCHKCNLNSHMRKHSGEKPHKCDLCSKAFHQKSKLNRHMRTHTGEKPHKCDICSKAFCQKSQLKRHMRKHTVESPYNCSVCSKAFYDQSHLNTHLRTHTGDRPHGCDKCSKTFSKKSHLRQHILLHTGEKPHKCELCSKAFRLKSNLNSHITRRHTGKKPHKCNM